MKRILATSAFVGLFSGAYLLGLSQSNSASIAHANLPDSSATEARYGYHGRGTLLGVGDFAANGVLVFNADGTLTATESVNLEGQIFHSTYTGSWTLGPDNTGSFTTIDAHGGASSFAWVLTARRERGTAVMEDAGIVALMEMERQ
jgi:hypothetical protein